MLLRVRDEIEQSFARLHQLESQIALHAQIILNRPLERVHRAPPGQGNASACNAWAFHLYHRRCQAAPDAR